MVKGSLNTSPLLLYPICFVNKKKKKVIQFQLKRGYKIVLFNTDF